MSQTMPYAILLGCFALTLPLVTPQIRGADEIEYYSYLRSGVFDGDFDFDDEYRYFYERDPGGLSGFAETFLGRVEPATGRRINFAPLGTALLWAPFYLLAHGGVLAGRVLWGWETPADGFSAPYLAAASYASALYAFLGLLLVYELLWRVGRFAPALALAAVVAIWFGTPVLYYMTVAPGFSHACSLFAVALICWRAAVHLDAQHDSVRAWAWTGVSVGLAALVREQDALFGIVPFVVLASRFGSIARGGWLARAGALAGGAFVAFVPQLLAYRAINGSYRPSTLVARKMSYSSPHFFEVLADPHHGLVFWSPVLALALVGLAASLGRRRSVFVVGIAVALLLQVWINGAVESWSQAGAFGSRRFVGASVIFAWGLAAAFRALTDRGLRLAPVVVVGLAAWWNVSLMIQFGLRLMDRQRLEWPKVAINQVTAVPLRFTETAHLFFTDREQLVRGSR